MARTTVTEESLGLSPSEDELSSVVHDSGDDIPIDDHEPEPALAPAKPGESKKPTPPVEAKAEDPPVVVEKPAEEAKLVDVRAVQEARAEAREAKQRATVLEQRWNEFFAAQNAKPKAEEPPIPKFTENPVEAGQWMQDQIIAANEQRQREAEERQAQTAEQQQLQAAINTAQQQFAERANTDPTVVAAYEALKGSYVAEMQALGFSPQQAAQELQRIEADGIKFALSRGIHVADYVVGVAKARGWQPQAAQQDPAPKTDLQAVAAAQQRHQSLSDAGGSEAIAPLDAKALAKMTDKQFKAWISKKGNEQKLDEILGA